MSKRSIVLSTLSCLFLFTTGLSVAQDQDSDNDRDVQMDQDQTQDRLRDQDIYGWQMMTPEEREQYRAKMRAARTAEEREQLRKEHHEQMQARAKERGTTLPDEPPMRDMQQRMDDRMRSPGGGMGSGRGGGYNR